ncbi:MAG: ATP-binding cassette domain-containing protein [Defluviitaleaceae bacterium]|nr:ATP-binding cassette domain-containing protein [Defluviitaleaceae bacterium]
MLEIKNINLSLSLNDRNLADNFSFVLNPGDKAVIIGEEGNGKSTLLKLIYDESLVSGYCNYSGQILRKGSLAYLPQMFPEEELNLTLEEYFSDSMSPQILSRLGIPTEFTISSQRINTLSGGEKIKIQLAKILFSEPDVLLLDEPTNDIDLPTLEWLEDFISSCRQPVIFISHDETLIERTANVIIHMEQLMRKTKAKITVTYSTYAKYVKARNIAFDKQKQVARKQRAEHKAQMLRWKQIHDKVDHQGRNIAKEDRDSAGRLLKKKMKAVKSTGKRLEKQSEDFLELPDMEEAILTQFDPNLTIPQGKVVLAMELPELLVDGRQLSGPIALNINGPQRIGIVGRNGVGKSTFLKKIWEALAARKDITATYMPQDYAEVLDYNKPVIDFLATDGHKDTITKVRTYLGSMKFTADEMLGKIGKLSGGQKAKVLFLDMVLKKANVLVLDEPTRNFSPLSAPEIRKTLTNFGGGIISVSHDRKYLSEVCEKVFELTREGLQHYY